jgi:hypothetical protein
LLAGNGLFRADGCITDRVRALIGGMTRRLRSALYDVTCRPDPALGDMAGRFRATFDHMTRRANGRSDRMSGDFDALANRLSRCLYALPNCVANAPNSLARRRGRRAGQKHCKPDSSRQSRDGNALAEWSRSQGHVRLLVLK